MLPRLGALALLSSVCIAVAFGGNADAAKKPTPSKPHTKALNNPKSLEKCRKKYGKKVRFAVERGGGAIECYW